MTDRRYFEPVIDDEGFISQSGYWAWQCEECPKEVITVSGDVTCWCGAEYNAFGQRLRDNWRDNPSCWDDEIGDMEGYEMSSGNDW